FKRVSDQGHRSGLAQKQGSLPDDRLMRQNQKKRQFTADALLSPIGGTFLSAKQGSNRYYIGNEICKFQQVL
ncbi:hypothetical protein KKJ09_19875, partial [Xenorhabdus bovienii]|uniref:hypothetical protein n=1 Tax=Xenorhabdus bovienii TaxID=40576 RepID=UPI0023B31A8F